MKRAFKQRCACLSFTLYATLYKVKVKICPKLINFNMHEVILLFYKECRFPLIDI